MKRTNAISAIILLVVMAGCGGGGKQPTDDIITVDVRKSYPKKELILQDCFDVEYIQLETTDEFLVRANNLVIGQEIIIDFDTRSRDITVFDRNGNGLRKINRRGQGPGEHISVFGMALDQDADEMFVLDVQGKKVFVYDLFGTFKRILDYGEKAAPLMGLRDNSFRRIYNFDQNNLICYHGDPVLWEDEGKYTFWLMSKQDGSVTAIQIPYQEKKMVSILTVNASGSSRIAEPSNHYNHFTVFNGNGWLLTEPSSDTVYLFQPDYRMVPFIARTPSIQSMEPEVFLFPNAVSGSYVFMQTVKRVYDFTANTGFPRTDLMYDSRENALFEYVMYNDDYAVRKPLNLYQQLDEFTIVNSDEIAFLQRLQAFDLVEAYGKGELKGRLKEIAAELDPEDNAIIMVAKHKK